MNQFRGTKALGRTNWLRTIAVSLTVLTLTMLVLFVMPVMLATFLCFKSPVFLVTEFLAELSDMSSLAVIYIGLCLAALQIAFVPAINEVVDRLYANWDKYVI